MALLDSSRPPETSARGTGPPAACSPDVSRLGRGTKRWALISVVLCPCHLWLVAALLGFAGAGASAAAIRDNQVLLTVVLVPLTAAALWRAYRLTCRANDLRAAGAICSPR